ncbi:MAG TPA: PaaI family thioesterase [Stellaceae bacterium]|nr:PaaI family thioesterase [Stellaceae bacterium]
MTAARITIEAFQDLMLESMPFAVDLGIETLEIGFGTARLRLPFREGFLRPGGTVGGPILMGLADVALYVAVLGAAGPVPLAVTTNLNTHFLRKPGPAAILAEARLLKHGKRLAVGEVALYTEGDPEMIAHVVGTYSLPPRA